MAYATVTLTGTYQTPDQTPHKGHVEIIPSERVIKDTTGDVILTGRVKVDLDAQGAFSVVLPATDDPTLNPTGFGYTIAAKLHSSHPPAVSFSLPAALGATTVEDLTPVDPSTFAPTTTYAESSEVAALDSRVTTVETTKADAADIPTTPGEVGAEPAGLSTTTQDQLSATFAKPVQVGSGRGAIAIELDDALADHFTDVLPVTQELGIPMGTAWHTDNGRDAEVADAYAKGWEILSHLPADVDSTTLTATDLAAQAESSVAKIAAITGRDDNIAFVYPRHARNNATDKVLSKYFTRGRGIASGNMQPKTGHPWLISASILDSEIDANGNLSDALVTALTTTARSDGRMLFYWHYANAALHANRLTGLRNLVSLARALGIQIVKPSDLSTSTDESSDRFVKQAALWGSTYGTKWSVSTDRAFKGTQSLKFTPNAPGGGQASGDIQLKGYQPVAPTPGMFKVYRVSMRYSTDGPFTVGTWGGQGFKVGLSVRDVNGNNPSVISGSGVSYGDPWGGANTSFGATDWQRVSRTLVLGPDVSQLIPFWLDLQNVQDTSAPLYVDDIRFDLTDTVSAMSYTATLNGTTGVAIRTGIPLVERYGVSIVPQGSVAGRLYYTTSGDRLTVKSTDATDTTQTVRVTVHPTISYANLTYTDI